MTFIWNLRKWKLGIKITWNTTWSLYNGACLSFSCFHSGWCCCWTSHERYQPVSFEIGSGPVLSQVEQLKERWRSDRLETYCWKILPSQFQQCLHNVCKCMHFTLFIHFLTNRVESSFCQKKSLQIAYSNNSETSHGEVAVCSELCAVKVSRLLTNDVNKYSWYKRRISSLLQVRNEYWPIQNTLKKQSITNVLQSFLDFQPTKCIVLSAWQLCLEPSLFPD